MERVQKAHLADGQAPGMGNFYRMIGQQVGRFVFAVIEGCAWMTWQLWKALHPKPTRQTKA
jgi:hypothetical protein